jgi:hypothetical protein
VGRSIVRLSLSFTVVLSLCLVIAGLDPPAGPKPLRRGEGPAIS